MSERNGNAAGWILTTLDDIGTLYCGQSPPSKSVNSDGNGIVYITGPEQWDGKRILIDKWTTDPRRISPDGCIFVTVKGSGVGTIFPRIASAIGRDIYAYCPSESVSPAFIQYILHATIDIVKRQAKGDIPGLTKDHLLKHEIGLPPLAEQRRIVAKIEALQERSRLAREALSEVAPLLEQFRQSVLAAAFRGDLTADWRATHPNVEPASELLHRIRAERRHRWEQAELVKYEAKGQVPPKNWKERYKEPEPADYSDLPDLPDSWCWVSLDDLLAEPLANGRSVKDGNGFPVLRLTALKNRRIDLSEYKLGAWNATDAARFIVQKGDFLVSRGNGSIDLVGRGGLVIDEPHDQVAYPDTLIRVRLTSSFDRYLLTLLWDSAIIRQKIEAAAHTTAGIYKISQSDLQQIPLSLPPLEEQREIVFQAIDHLNGIERLSGEVFKALNALDYLDQSILAKAFRGELVPQDPSDEPASVLLERIRAQREQQAEATQKTFKMRRRSKMEKKSSRLASQRPLLVEVLAGKGQAMSPERLLTEAGYERGSIEDFYLALREEIKKGRIREDRRSERDIMLEAVEQ